MTGKKEDYGQYFSPFIRRRHNTGYIMGTVAVSLLPAWAAGIYYFGIRAFWIVTVCIFFCLISEYLWEKLMGRQVTIKDNSALVTGILLGFNLPVTCPLWAAAAAGIFSIIIAKQIFGGIGSNFVNPALTGRLFLMTLWPQTLMSYEIPRGLSADTYSSVTVLSAYKAGAENSYDYGQMFLGQIPGAIGETGKLFLLAGFLYLCIKGIVNVQVSIAYLVTVLLLTWIFAKDGLFTGDILLNLLGGSLILGSFYMVTDYSFVSAKGRILYGIAAGVMTAVIRIFSGYPEGVCIGILTANALAGLMEKMEFPRVYGTGEEKILESLQIKSQG